MVRVTTNENRIIEGILLNKDENYIHLVEAKVFRTKGIEDWSKYSIPMCYVDKIEYMEV